MNTNGIPDWWETKYFGRIVSNTDADGDGRDNYSEYVANTDPTNALSVFTVGGMVTNSSKYMILIPTQPDRLYSVEAADNLISNVWTVITSNIPGTGSPVPVYDNTGTKKTRFYRSRVNVLP